MSAFITSHVAFLSDTRATIAVTASALVGVALYASAFVWLGLVTTQAIGIGLLYHATGGWTWPMLALTAMAAATGVLAVFAGRPQFIEDQLGPSRPAPGSG